MAYTKTGPAYWTANVEDPHGMLAKRKLSILMQHDPKASRRDRILWDFHLDWSHEDHAHTSLASVRLIHEVLTDRSPTGKSPLSQRHINKGNQELCRRGYLTELDHGAGRKGSRFGINWDLLSQASQGRFPPSVSPLVHATADESCVYPLVHATVYPSVHANDDSVSPSVDKDPLTFTRLQTGLKVGTSEVAAAPTAPPVDALEGATADTAGFERVWSAYGELGTFKLAEAAFAAIDNPDVDQIEERARAWRISAKPGKRRMPLEKWLTGKRYREADRKVTPVDKPSKAKGKSTADNDNTADEAKPFVPVDNIDLFAKPGRFRGTIIKAKVDSEETEKGPHDEVTITICGDDGESVRHNFPIQCADYKVQDRGQRILDTLGGVREDASELVGRKFVVTIGEDWSIRYDPIAPGDPPVAEPQESGSGLAKPPRWTSGPLTPLKRMLAASAAEPEESEADRLEREEYEADLDRRAKAFAARYADDDLDDAA